MRIAIGGFQHETNTFAPSRATYERFVQGGGWPPVSIGEEIFERFQNQNIPISGFMKEMGSAHALIDPEALIIESAIISARIDDPRIADAAIAWSIQHHELIITARLKALLKLRAEADREAFLMMSRRIIDLAGRLAWPAAPTASAWKPSVDVRLPLLADRPELLRLRSRALNR